VKIRISNSDLYLRIISLVVAIIFWLFAKQNMQIPNITQRQQYQKVMKKVVFTDIAEGIILTSEVPEVFLEISGPFWELTQNQDQIVVYASLKNRRAGRHSVDVEVRVPEGVNIIQYYPEAIDIRLEGLRNRELSVSPISLGSLSSGQELKNITITPDQVTIYGPDSLVNTASIATVTLDLSDIEKGQHQLNLLIQIRARDGSNISGLNLDPTQAQVNFDILEQAVRTVPVVLDMLTEELDFENLEITITPDEVSVVGNSKIEAISSEQFMVEEIPFIGEVELVTPPDSEIWPKNVEVSIEEIIKEEEE